MSSVANSSNWPECFGPIEKPPESPTSIASGLKETGRNTSRRGRRLKPVLQERTTPRRKQKRGHQRVSTGRRMTSCRRQRCAAYWAFCAGAALQQSRAASIAADVSALSAGLPLSTPGQPYLTSRAEGDPAVEAAKEISNELIVEAQQQGLGSTAEPETITQYFAAIIRRHFAGYVPASELAAAKLRGDVLQAEVLRWTKWREEQPWLVELDGFAAQLGQHVGWLRASEAEANNLRADLVRVTEERDNYKYLWQDVATTSKDLRPQLAAARTVIEAKDAAIREQLDTLGPNGRCVPWNFAYSKLTVALALTLDAPVQAPKGGIVTARILAGDALPFPPTPTKDT